MKIETLSYTELVALKGQVEAALKKCEAEEKSKARKQIIELVRAYDLNLEEMVGKTGAVRKPVEPKYRHPQNHALTWTGRGRKPIWVVELLSKGKTLADLLI